MPRRVKVCLSRRPFEALEAPRESVSIGAVLDAVRQMDGATIQLRQGLEHGAVVLPEQPLGYMQPIVRVDADQMRIEGCVMDLRQRETVWHHRLAESLVRVRDDVGCVQKDRFRQSRQRASARYRP